MVKCSGKCNRIFHNQCTDIKQTRSGQKSLNWKCKDCSWSPTSNNTDTPTLTTGGDPADGETTMNDLMREIKNINYKISDISSIKQDMKELKESTEFLSSKFDQFEHEIKKISTMERSITYLQTENTEMKSKVKTLEETVLHLEFEQVANQLLIENIPVTQGEDVMAIIQKVFKYINAEIRESEIVEVKRLYKPTTNLPLLL